MLSVFSRPSPPPANSPNPASPPLEAAEIRPPGKNYEPQHSAPQGAGTAEPAPGPAPPGTSGAAPPADTWREELSDRVQDFRRRRARLRGGFDPSTSLDLEFGAGDDAEPENAVGARVIEVPPVAGAPELDLNEVEKDAPVLESIPLGKSIQEGGPATAEVLEISLNPPDAGPVEIVLDGVEPPVQLTSPDLRPILPLAPLGQRFLAGLVDAGVLLLAAGVFAGIFWFAGGYLSFQPLNITVLAFMSVFFIMVYFGVFTALAGATPGLLLMALEVRNWEGYFPSARESFWRAFGYVISTAALMLGFVWALVDSEGLTWHDHMSGTFLTVRNGG